MKLSCKVANRIIYAPGMAPHREQTVLVRSSSCTQKTSSSKLKRKLHPHIPEPTKTAGCLVELWQWTDLGEGSKHTNRAWRIVLNTGSLLLKHCFDFDFIKPVGAFLEQVAVSLLHAFISLTDNDSDNNNAWQCHIVSIVPKVWAKASVLYCTKVQN